MDITINDKENISTICKIRFLCFYFLIVPIKDTFVSYRRDKGYQAEQKRCMFPIVFQMS